MVMSYKVDKLELAQVNALVLEMLSIVCKENGSSHYLFPFRSYCASQDEFYLAVAELAAKKGLIEEPIQMHPGRNDASIDGRNKIATAVWNLVSQGVLYVELQPSRRYNNDELVYGITEYGIQMLTDGKITPHDPEGMVSYLQSVVPNVDDIILVYFREAVYAYNANLLLSSTTSIGCASEKALLLLIEQYSSFLKGEERKKFRNKINGKHVKNQFEEFDKSFSGHRSEIDKELIDGIDITINGVFELLRQNRNVTGHPTGKMMKREQTFASLHLFVVYCQKIYKLIEFFGEKTLKENTQYIC